MRIKLQHNLLILFCNRTVKEIGRYLIALKMRTMRNILQFKVDLE